MSTADTVVIGALADKFQNEVYVELTESELADAQREFEGALVIKLVGRRSFNKNGFRSIFSQLWSKTGSVTFSEVDDYVLMAKFAKDEEKERVLKSGPWLYMGWAVLIARWIPGKQLDDLFSEKLQMIVQVHNLPLELRTEHIARKCVARTGNVISYVEPNVGSGSYLERRKFHRFRIEIDLKLPIVAGCMVGGREGTPSKVLFRYEKLPNVCFNCGMFDHETTQCGCPTKERIFELGKMLRADFQAMDLTEPGDKGVRKDLEPEKMMGQMSRTHVKNMEISLNMSGKIDDRVKQSFENSSGNVGARDNASYSSIAVIEGANQGFFGSNEIINLNINWRETPLSSDFKEPAPNTFKGKGGGLWRAPPTSLNAIG